MKSIIKIWVFLLSLSLVVCPFAFAGQIHEAVKNGDIATVKSLLDNDPSLLYSKDEQGKTPLHWAAGREQLEIMKLLLDTYHVNVDVRNDNNGTPLHVSAAQAHPGAAKILIEHHAQIDARAGDNATPLCYAAIKGKAGHIEVARILIENGADVNARMNNGATPLAMALYRNNTEMAQLLRANGAKQQGNQGSGTRRMPAGMDID